jgi:hypothetical protein
MAFDKDYNKSLEEDGMSVTESDEKSTEAVHLEIGRINTRMLHDQQTGLAARDGCLSPPGGPAC